MMYMLFEPCLDSGSQAANNISLPRTLTSTSGPLAGGRVILAALGHQRSKRPLSTNVEA